MHALLETNTLPGMGGIGAAVLGPDALARRDGPVERRFVTVPGGPRLAYAEAGSGPDLILVHGALMTLDDLWLGPMAALAEHFHVVVVDRPGHGASEHVRLADGSLWRQADILHDFARELGLHRPVLVGHSFGAAVALAHGIAYREATAGVVAISPICFPELRLEQMLFGPRALPVTGDLLARLLRVGDKAMLPLLWRAMFLPQAMPAAFAEGFPFALAGEATRLVADGENANLLWSDLTRSALSYGQYRVPVQILAGSADLVTNPMVHGRSAAHLIPGAKFAWMPGYGHMLHHFCQTEIVAAARSVAEAV